MATTSPLTSQLQYWRNFDLPNFQKQLDETATEVANRQDESENSRKLLVEASREFKKNTPEDVRKAAAPLLKSFQTEIDNLSKRSKLAEAAFLNVYKKLIEIPDPIPVLDSVAVAQKKAQRANDLEIEVNNLKDTIEQYNVEFAEIKNQEVTIRQLKEKVRTYEEQLEATVQARVAEKETTLKHHYEEREKQFQEAGGILSVKLQEADRRALALQGALNDAQREIYELKLAKEEQTSVRSSETEMLIAEAERANQRATLAERECEMMKEQLAEMSSSTATNNTSSADTAELVGKNLSLEAELNSKDKQISHLLEEVQKSQAAMKSWEKDNAHKVEELQEKLAQKAALLTDVQSKLDMRSDYDEIHRELSVLKSIEFDGTQEDSAAVEAKPIETLLLEKNKHLQTENTTLKVANQKVEGSPVGGVVGVCTPLQRSPSQTSAMSTPGPFQPIVDVVGQLVGRELVNEFNTEFSDSSLVEELEQLVAHNRKISSKSGINELANRLLTAASAEQLENNKKSSSHSVNLSLSAITVIPEKSDDPKRKVREVYESAVIQEIQDKVARTIQRLSISRLNTVEVAQRCKQALNLYSIGQRLFAKCVLNQSQGALSELLAKPKPWEKLTEKGRDSFRKIYAWVIDEEAIECLRQLCPKRFASPFRTTTASSAVAPQEDSRTVERISAILSQAKQVTQTPMVPTTSTSSVSRNNCASPISSCSSQNAGVCQSQKARSYRYRHDDIPKDKIFQIYQRELNRIKSQEQSLQDELKSRVIYVSAGKSPSVSTQSSPNETSSAKEIGEVGNGETGNNDSRIEEFLRGILSFSSGSVATNGNGEEGANGTLPVKQEVEDIDYQLDSLSKIQNITNALGNSYERSTANGPTGMNILVAAAATDSSAFHFTPSGTRSLKAVLPPISQDQFERYGNLSTDDVVQKIKEFLNQHSISQRLFGECVLGLSQGSVSDLLARPKPWNMLTQKGREPFIRMQNFLDDSDSIEKLIKSKGHCTMATLTSPPDIVKAELSDHIYTQEQSGCASPEQSGSKVDGNSKMSRRTSENGVGSPRLHGVPPNGRGRRSSTRFSTRFVDKSVYELAAFVPDLDTVEVTDKVKADLLANNIGQKVFGEAILGLSQGSVSELLSKPKHWDMLSLKGREPFIRMHFWLNDTDRIEKLNEYRTHRGKRPYSFAAAKNSLMEANIADTSAISTESDSGISENKRQRVLLTTQQREILKLAFTHVPYPTSGTTQYLAEQLGLSERTVVNFFHNRRMRLKEELTMVRRDYSQLVENFTQKLELIKSLEQDLMNVGHVQTNLQSDLVNMTPQDPGATDIGPVAIVQTPSDSLVPILANQRDRFRLRVVELEEENMKYQQQLALMQTQNDKIQGDNVKLYEKIKFLQSYGQRGQTFGGRTEDTEAKYSSQYEEGLNPFAKFSQQERQRKYVGLKPHEKASLGISRLLISSSAARYCFFLYLLMLHCLVFLVLYKFAYSETCRRDYAKECAQKFQEHMQVVHGDKGHSHG